jgi:thymidylate synthase
MKVILVIELSYPSGSLIEYKEDPCDDISLLSEADDRWFQIHFHMKQRMMYHEKYIRYRCKNKEILQWFLDTINPDIIEYHVSLNDTHTEGEKLDPKYFYNISYHLFQDKKQISICNVNYNVLLTKIKDGFILTCNRIYEQTNVGEEGYLCLLREILNRKTMRDNRTGISTKSVFGRQLVFDVRDRFPLLTIKKVPHKTVLKELLWFVSGSSDANILKDQGVHIWDGNTTREFLDNRGLLHLPEGSIGKGYGFQWRNWGGGFKDQDGVDQLQQLIDTIKKDPTCRRLLVSAWNVSQIPEMALPPCHYCFQIYVDENEMDMMINMRSCDLPLGFPFNVASYSYLLYMIAATTGHQPRRVIFNLGDVHVYENAIPQSLLMCYRKIIPCKTRLELSKRENIDDYVLDDFKVDDYQHHSYLKIDMCV